MGITKNGTPLRFGGNTKSNMSWCLGRPDQPTCNVGEIQIFGNQKDNFQAIWYVIKSTSEFLPKI